MTIVFRPPLQDMFDHAVSFRRKDNGYEIKRLLPDQATVTWWYSNEELHAVHPNLVEALIATEPHAKRYDADSPIPAEFIHASLALWNQQAYPHPERPEDRLCAIQLVKQLFSGAIYLECGAFTVGAAPSGLEIALDYWSEQITYSSQRMSAVFPGWEARLAAVTALGETDENVIARTVCATEETLPLTALDGVNLENHQDDPGQ